MKRYTKKMAAVFCAAVLAMTGCSSNHTAPTAETTKVTEETTQESVTETTEKVSETTVETKIFDMVIYPVIIAGTDGDEIVLEAEPERVISVGPNITELIYSLGAEEKLVGRTEYCDYPNEVLSVDTIGTLYTPDTEKILSLEPDLVIASIHFKEESRTQLEEFGIPVLVLYEKTDVTGVYKMIDTMGTALNVKEVSQEVVADMEERINAVEEKVKDAEPVDIYYVVGFGESGDFTAGGDTFIHGILTAAGGRNIAEEVNGWSYSVESLLEADPEVILLSEEEYDGFIAMEPYCELSAVKNGKVYTIDGNMLDRQCVRNADAIEEIARMLHPGLFE